MLTVTRNAHSLHLPSLIVRTLATESFSNTELPLPPPVKPPSSDPQKPRTRLYPHPRPASYRNQQALPSLPSSFGRNQLLPVSNSTRALLESIVSQFDAPIRYAFAYGSGVFEQDGYNHTSNSGDPSAPMLDFMFAVTHPAHFHSINMHQNPSHYTLHAKLFGSDYVSRVQEMGPGVWFNAFVPMNGVMIKYGVTTVDTLCSDLLNWRSLYLAGRMHKPLRIIKDDARVRLTQQVNLTSAIRSALLQLPATFTEAELFETISAISYAGDPRMWLPAENRNKVKNIVSRQSEQFREVYRRLVLGLPGVHWNTMTHTLDQDASPQARAGLVKKLPSNLLTGVKRHYGTNLEVAGLEADETSYWLKLAADDRLSEVLRSEMKKIVAYPATIQTFKGIVSSGLGKSLRYSTAKIGKWWKGTTTDSQNK
ncbi:mitochondrial matrix Mmp37-domain-containing protein [Mycena floridula]|nr:mitochondrial matrix Mmp37-domain-containing protein [Mycena floridula]